MNMKAPTPKPKGLKKPQAPPPPPPKKGQLSFDEFREMIIKELAIKWDIPLKILKGPFK